MRKFIITIILLLLAVYLYLVLAIEHDKKWFENFSQSGNDSSDTRNTNQNSSSKAEIDEHGHLFLGEAYARSQLQKFLNDKKQFTWDTLIRDKETAIAIVEPILFEKFGKEQILTEKPYEVYLINGYWYLSGTIPKGSMGGGFEIIMSAKDGQIIRLTHYK